MPKTLAFDCFNYNKIYIAEFNAYIINSTMTCSH